MLIKYFKLPDATTPFAERSRDIVPRKGDSVNLNNQYFIITDVCWVEDYFQEYVAIYVMHK
jgi:hypothetical protein